MKLIASLLTLLLLCLLGLTWCAALVIQDEPLVTAQNEPTPEDLRRARAIIRELYDSSARAGEAASLSISEDDIALLLGYLLNTQQETKAEADIEPDALNLRMTTRLAGNPFGDWFNTRLSLIRQDDDLLLNSLRLGDLRIPDWLAERLLQRTHRELRRRVSEYDQLMDSIIGFSLSEQQLTLEYRLDPALLDALSDRGQELLISPGMRERLQSHTDRLYELLSEHNDRRYVSLADILGPMFNFAASRPGSPAEENRAAIIVIGLHQLGFDINRLLQGSERIDAENSSLQFRLYNRGDSAQHFIGSAALAISTEPGMADTLALLKEMDDAEEGSGFSFTDLAADMAGIRFAELAAGSDRSGFVLQDLLREQDPLPESYFMFDFRDLPEFLSQEQFRADYTNTSSAAYREVVEEIEQRIAETPLFEAMRNAAPR